MPSTANVPPRADHVAVLGGGPAGLAAAWKLIENGCKVTVLEAEDGVGGLAATQVFEGRAGTYRFDFGGHRFLTKNPELLAFIEQLMGDDLMHAQRSSVIRYQGRTYDYPLSLGNLLRNAPPGLLAGASLDLLNKTLRPPNLEERDDEISFAEWIEARFGKTLYRNFFEGYTGKLWGIDPRQLSGDWAAQRISLIDLRDVARRLIQRRGDTPRTYARHYRYPRHGFGMIFDNLVDLIHRHGGEVITGAPVKGFVREAGRIKAVRFGRDGDEGEMPVDAVISSLPLPEMVRMLGGESRLGFRALRFLNMPMRGPDISPHTWQYLSDPDILATRLQEPRRRSPYMAPEGHTSVMLEIPCNVGDATWRMDGETLRERAHADLERLGIPRERATGEHFSAYAAHAYPLMALGYHQERQRNLGYLGRFDNLLMCGRQGTFRYIFTDTAMEMGQLAAQALLEQRDLRHEIYNHRNEKTVIETQSVA
ncbi:MULTISPECIES: FAD-dependent oxidoreductase [unclassified Modicisalibacter]|uniref:FAD-dependent oxidoreductase n=1 Tax=unclassified Modicisalibacter TaxID=2679913 RepID=UPI001CCF61F9|nr:MULTISPECIES: FAD-dependent oxidoreductase [unclassified Modicisalibacter]MBZ9560112.1 FAD-dependent oxidoreductase [Modicisalibacter sp. R2A 31.J]MBZ9576020.1 FAD-dependent oxidoreductase [Modicisalibacter sp. MOD 31.J]